MTDSDGYGPDVTEVMREDHSAIVGLLDELVGAGDGPQRRGAFHRVGEALARHEAAEEVVIYPHLARLAAPQAGAVRAVRLAEERRAQELMAGMARPALLHPGGRRFRGQCDRLRTAVREHAAAEEAAVLPLLGDEDDTKLRVMATMFEAARRTAPTRPHPRAPQGRAGLLLLGPALALSDRVRDLLRRRLIGT